MTVESQMQTSWRVAGTVAPPEPSLKDKAGGGVWATGRLLFMPFYTRYRDSGNLNDAGLVHRHPGSCRVCAVWSLVTAWR